MSNARLLQALVCSVIASAPAAAQDVAGSNEFARRSSGSISFIQSRPMGGLRHNIGFGYGGTGAYMFRLDRVGALSLRGDLGILVYGNESYSVPFSSTVGGRVRVKVSTNNNLVPMAIGPQLSWPSGPLRPYVNAGLGGQFFFTQSSVRDEDGYTDDDPIASTTNQSDWTGAWVTGGGLYVMLSQKRLPVALDLGVQYYGGGRAQYLRPGSIEDLPGGDIVIHPLESDTHLMLVRIGVRIGY